MWARATFTQHHHYSKLSSIHGNINHKGQEYSKGRCSRGESRGFSAPRYFTSPPPSPPVEEEFVRITRDADDNNKPTGVVILTLNRPEKLNAMTEEVGKGIVKAVEELKVDSTLRAVVVTGAGKAFSAGGDLNFLLDRRTKPMDENIKTMMQFYSRFLSIRSLPVPVIAAINGAAVGAGMCFAMACDMRYASKQAKLALNFTKLGIHPGLAATYFLPRITNPMIAAKLLYTSDFVTAGEAKELGIVLDVLNSGEEAVKESVAVARRIAANSPIAVRQLVLTLREQDSDALSRSINTEAFRQSFTYTAPDLLEGINAVKEKRDPSF